MSKKKKKNTIGIDLTATKLFKKKWDFDNHAWAELLAAERDETALRAILNHRVNF